MIRFSQQQQTWSSISEIIHAHKINPELGLSETVQQVGGGDKGAVVSKEEAALIRIICQFPLVGHNPAAFTAIVRGKYKPGYSDAGQLFKINSTMLYFRYCSEYY